MELLQVLFKYAEAAGPFAFVFVILMTALWWINEERKAEKANAEKERERYAALEKRYFDENVSYKEVLRDLKGMLEKAMERRD